jgi:hypothetical protein
LPSRNRAHAAIRRAPDRYRTPLSISRGSPHVKRVQQVQRRCPWARATIASPYIRQLRYGLPLCCMHGQSREKDGLIFTTADWRGQICDGFRQPRIRPAQRSTQRSVGIVSRSSCVPRRWWVEDRALWHQTVLDVTPKGDRQLARNSDDHGLPHARALTCSALKKPSGECALRLMPDPQPCGLDHNGPHVATARSRNPLAALLLAAAVGAWGEAQKASHLPPVGKLAVIDLTRKQAEIAGPMLFSRNRRRRLRSVASQGVGAVSRSRSILAICSCTMASLWISRATSQTSRGGKR